VPFAAKNCWQATGEGRAWAFAFCSLTQNKAKRQNTQMVGLIAIWLFRLFLAIVENVIGFFLWLKNPKPEKKLPQFGIHEIPGERKKVPLLGESRIL